MRYLFLFMTVLWMQSAAAELYRGPISSAMGGTGRAGLQSSEGAFLNPAVIPLIKKYEFISFYRDGYIGRGQHRQGWALGAVDNSEEVFFPGAAHYAKVRDTGRARGGTDGEIWHAAGAYLISDHLSIGASAYRVKYESKLDRTHLQWSGSLGMVVLLSDDVSLAYVFDNIARPGSATPLGLREDPKHSLGSFVRFFDLLATRFDVERESEFNSQGKLKFMTGIESSTSEFVVMRFGYSYDDLRNQRLWTAGFGFNGPRLKLDYSFEKNQVGTSGALHSVDLRVPF